MILRFQQSTSMLFLDLKDKIVNVFVHFQLILYEDFHHKE
jgi:hypothetical protein